MVAEKHSRLVPASYLESASCLLPAYAGLRRGKPESVGRNRRIPPLPAADVMSPGWRDQPAGHRPGDGWRSRLTAEALLSQLTPCERMVAIHVAQGLSNKEISSALGRAEPTIKHQISSALRKLGVQDRCQLIVRLLT